MRRATMCTRYMDCPLILDGGLATELETKGAKLLGDPLWSARFLHTDPQLLKDVHYRYLLSGADIITTATYQASVEGFMKYLDLTSQTATELLMSGVNLAKDTVKQFVSENGTERYPLVAASMGPYGAFLLDASEYNGAYAVKMSIEELKDWHRPQISSLASAGADLIAFETVPSIKEAVALLELLKEYPNSKAWLSFSCKDSKCISDGSPFAEAVQIANTSSQLIAVGVNCCSPSLVKPLLNSVKSQLRPDRCWIAYPNNGDVWDVENGWQLTPEKTSVPELSSDWIKQGAGVIGGCCHIGPTQIAELHQKLHGSSLSQEPQLCNHKGYTF